MPMTSLVRCQARESVAFALCPGEWLAELQGTDFLASSSPSQSTSKRYRGTSTLKKWGNLASKVDLGQCDKGVFPAVGQSGSCPVCLPGFSWTQVRKPSCSLKGLQGKGLEERLWAHSCCPEPVSHASPHCSVTSLPVRPHSRCELSAVGPGLGW